MSAQIENSVTATPKKRPQPLWPWLLMPLVALALFLVLRNARQAPAAVEQGAAAAGTIQH